MPTPASSPCSLRSDLDTRRHPERPIVGIGVIVWHGERVLLIRRGHPPRQGEWSLPGGAQRLGETVGEAAAREVREEAGIEIELGCLVAVVDLIDREPDGRIRYHYTLLDYTAEARCASLRPGDDAIDARWFTLQALSGLGLWQETVRVILAAQGLRTCRSNPSTPPTGR